MSKDNVISIKKPDKSEDELVLLLRKGAQQMLAKAIEDEIQNFLASYEHLKDPKGSPQIVRNGYLPPRAIQTGIGQIDVHIPRIRDRSNSGIAFTSLLVPPYLRRTKNIEELLPVLYLKGISTGSFGDALTAIVGPNTKGFSAQTISRLNKSWEAEHETWRQRDLSKKRYVYFWADGIYLKARLEDKQCLLVIIGADEFGRKELISVSDGFRECEQSWSEILLDLKARGLKNFPELAVGDGSLGFWKALRKIAPKTKEQRCWVHKTANILVKLPKTLHKRAKQHIQDIWMNEIKKDAEKAFNFFLEAYDAKYPNATKCLAKDRESLLEFYNFPAEHWIHIRTTNPIESTFSTVRLRTDKTRGCLSRKTAFTMVFKLLQLAEKKWQKLRGKHRVAEIIRGVNFVDGIAPKVTNKIVGNVETVDTKNRIVA
jgi:transposase-like protein